MLTKSTPFPCETYPVARHWQLDCAAMVFFLPSSYLRPDGEVEEAVAAVEVERAVEVDDGLVAVLALQLPLPRLVARQDGVRDLRVGARRLVGVVRRDPAEYRQTCNFEFTQTSDRERFIPRFSGIRRHGE